MNTIEYLEKLKEKENGASDYKIAQLMGITKQTVYGWRAGRGEMDAYSCAQMAELLGIEPIKIIAEIEALKATNEDKRDYWRGLAGNAAAVFLTLPLAQLIHDCILC